MAQTTVNPYSLIGGYIPTGLASIIAALPTTPTIANLVSAVESYIAPLFYATGGSTTTQVQIEIQSVANAAINSYVNSLILQGQAGYDGSQMKFARILIGDMLTSNLPIVSISNRIEDVEDNLTDNQLSVNQQLPLLLATTTGSNANTYWAGQIAIGSSSPWHNFFPTSPENYMDIPYYVEAAMNGALAGYGATPAGMIEPSVNFVTNKMLSALIGALTVTAGKVIFQWIPRIQHSGFSTAMGLGGGIDSMAVHNVNCHVTDNCAGGNCNAAKCHPVTF